MFKFIITFGLVFGAEFVNAGALADQKAWAEVDVEVKKGQEDFKSYCGGGDVKVVIDKKSFNSPEALVHARQRCGEAVSNLGYPCQSDAAYKAAVVKGVTQLTCRFDPSLKSDNHHAIKMEKKGTAITFSFSKDISNADDEVKNFMNENL